MDMNQEKINPEGVANSIRLLKTYLDEIEIDPLIIALEGLKENPDSAQHLANVNTAFNNLGISQGAVLTYAPYMIILVSNDPFSDLPG